MKKLTALALIASVVISPAWPSLAAAPAKQTIAKPRALSPSAKRGLVFAKTHCAACHGVTANAGSPNPEAPPWDDVANRPGTTEQTLHQFLKDSHNYPDAMPFKVAPARIRDLAAYLVTLRKAGYRPGI